MGTRLVVNKIKLMPIASLGNLFCPSEGHIYTKGAVILSRYFGFLFVIYPQHGYYVCSKSALLNINEQEPSQYCTLSLEAKT